MEERAGNVSLKDILKKKKNVRDGKVKQEEEKLIEGKEEEKVMSL